MSLGTPSSPQTHRALNKILSSGAAHLPKLLFLPFLKGRAVSPICRAVQNAALSLAVHLVLPVPCPVPWLAPGCVCRCCCSAAPSCSLFTLPAPLLGSAHAVLLFAGLLNPTRKSILQNIRSVRLCFPPSAGSLDSLGWKGLWKSSNQPPK